MLKLYDLLKTLDMHFTGKVMAVKAVEALKGAFNRDRNNAIRESQDLDGELLLVRDSKNADNVKEFRYLLSELMDGESSSLTGAKAGEFVVG